MFIRSVISAEVSYQIVNLVFVKASGESSTSISSVLHCHIICGLSYVRTFKLDALFFFF